MRRLVFAAVLLIPAYAHSQTPSSGIHVEQPWARATAPQQTTGAAYVTLTSHGGDRLLGASSPASARAEVHATEMEGDVARMRELTDGLDLPAGHAVSLAPGGIHIMLVDLRERLKNGQMIRVQLRFQHAPPLELEVPVGPVGARGPNAHGAGAHHH